jgi:hypothetical protein
MEAYLFGNAKKTNLFYKLIIKIMKKLILGILSIVLIASFSINGVAQTSATENTNAGAVLIVAMGITETAQMHFGTNVLTDALGGTVVLPSNSTTRSYTGGVATSAATPVASNAAYSVTGTANEGYAITLPASTTVTHTTVGTGVITMTITAMTARFNGAGSDAITSTLATDGTDSFTLGGTLTVQANQVGGIYAGTFDVIIDYN